jgi:hypothetical protein
MENDSLTDRQEAYHYAEINGETPETRDPRHDTGSFRSPRKFPASNSWPQEIRHQHRREVAPPAGPSGSHFVATLYFDSLEPAWHRPKDRPAAGDLANFADGDAELYFFDTKDV